MVLLQRKLYFQRIQRGPNVSGGGGGGPACSGGGGVQMLISIETHITCDFPGGGGRTPYPPSGSAHEHRSSKN